MQTFCNPVNISEQYQPFFRGRHLLSFGKASGASSVPGDSHLPQNAAYENRRLAGRRVQKNIDISFRGMVR